MLTKILSGLTFLKKDTKNKMYDPLISKMWITKGTRFTADQRLRSQYKWSSLSIAMLSIYLMALSSIDMLGISFVQKEYEPYVPAAFLFLSVFILIISMIENSKNHLLQAEKMHQCALEIQSLYHKLQLAIENKKDTYEMRLEMLKNYDAVLLKYPNHEERAFLIFKATNYTEENFKFGIVTYTPIKWPIAKIFLLWYWIQDFWLYIAFIFGPLIALLWAT